MSLDFSNKIELLPLAQMVHDLESVAADREVPYFLMGAAARDIVLLYAHGIETGRGTEDVDCAVMVDNWDSFMNLRERLISSGNFTTRPGPAVHRLRHKNGHPLDIVPFGSIERADRTIAWPPENAEVFDCFGISEAFSSCVEARLPAGVRLQVPSIPALALLKITAWRDRRLNFPGRDAQDLMLYVRHYLSCGNLDRAVTEHADMFDDERFDYEVASARLLARDMVNLLTPEHITALIDLLVPEADELGNLQLVQQSGLDLERGRQLLDALCNEFFDAMPKPV